jgi:hypothetical protein
LWIGLFQVLALFPVFALRFVHGRRHDPPSGPAFCRRFSFLMAIPRHGSRRLLSVFDLLNGPTWQFIPVMLSFYHRWCGGLPLHFLAGELRAEPLAIHLRRLLPVPGAAVLAFGFVFPQNPSPAAAVSETPSPEEPFLPSSIVYTPELNWLAPSAPPV